MAKKNKGIRAFFNSVTPPSYQKRVKQATRILSNQLGIKEKKAAKLAGLFIQQPKAMGTGRPGGRYWR